MWHPLRLAEDFATADILTKGRTVFGVGRGYHTREVETFGAPMHGPGRQPRTVRGAGRDHLQGVQQRSVLAQGQALHVAADVPYRGYELKELTLVPRPVNLPVECWQPIVSASPRGLDFMVRHGIKGAVGGGAATMAEGPIQAYQQAAARAGKDLKLGENLTDRHLLLSGEDAASRRSARCTPFYEEHVKMFAPLGFVPGDHAGAGRGGGAARRLGCGRRADASTIT